MSFELEPVGVLSARRPLAIRVLQRHGIDPSDPRALGVCCHERAVAVASISTELDTDEQRLTGPWQREPLPALIGHLVGTYHRRLEAAMTAAATAIAIVRPPSGRPGHVEWSALEHDLAELRADLHAHLAKEEQVLFPWLLGRADTAAAPIRAMQLEHTDTIEMLHALRSSMQRCLVASASNTHARDVAAKLDEIEHALCEHMHLEANELFPRALDGGNS